MVHGVDSRIQSIKESDAGKVGVLRKEMLH